MNQETIYELLTLKGWLLAIRENLGVGYYSYINAIDRYVEGTHRNVDTKALQHLRTELMWHYQSPRSQQESVVLERFVDALAEPLRLNSLQLQTS